LSLVRALAPLALAFLALGCSKEEAVSSSETAAIPDANGKPPPPMPGGMGADGRTSTPPEAAANRSAPSGG